MKLYLFLVILQLIFTIAQAWFETCDLTSSVQVSSTLVIKNTNYPNRYQSGSSCKWYLQAPTGYTIELKCSYNLDAPMSDCQSQRFYVSRDGDKALSYAEYFCASSSITRISVGNEVSLGYTSNIGGSGSFYCEAKAILTTQDNCQCGWSKTARIVGGSYAQPNEYVSMAGIIDITQNDAPEGPIFCGASLISENFALTAAHCFNLNRDISIVYLLVGDHDISRGDDTPYAALYKSQKIIKHANYIPTSDNQNYDIALVQTADAIRWKRTIGPACLPYLYNGYDTYFDGYQLTVLGYGMTEDAGPTSTILKKTSLAVIDNVSCNKTYGDTNSAKICTYTKGTDSCQRDSGGSLYWTYANRQYTIGIVSYGRGCASNNPSVNTRVTFYLGWIEQQLGSGFLCKR